MYKNKLKKKRTYKFLLIGSNGLLGSTLKKKLPKKETFLTAKNKSNLNLDLSDFKKLSKIFDKYEFKYVINCAAITSLHDCENNKKKTWKINTLLPEKLSKLSKTKKFKYIHISTDHIFFSKKKKYFTENSKVKIINFYSKTKIFAEKKIRNNKNNLVIRTNFTGFKKNNLKATFIGWILYNLRKKKKIKLFNDMYTSTIDVDTLSTIIIKLIKLNSKGIYNVAANGCINKKDFALKFSKLIKKQLLYKEISLNQFKIKRGFYLCLNVKKVEKKLGFKMIGINKVINNLSKQI